ncbi:MAG: diguanylate cyclase (GGDEF)-like protein [Oceanicoccus sp.]|jgi:diguanylate cyclase (GGDEF)-like protein
MGMHCSKEKMTVAMTLFRNKWSSVFTFILVYWIVAQLSMTLAIQPGNVTPIYPAAGMAWALVLIAGKRALPLVFLVGMLSNWTPLIADGFSLADFLCAICIGLGEVCSVYVATLLFDRFAQSNIRLDTPRAVIVFSSIALAWIISPTFGIGSLYLTGLIESQSIINAYVTWWLGDSMGVLLITPMALFAYRIMGRWKIWSKLFVTYAVFSTVTFVLSLFLFFSEYPVFYLLTFFLLLSAFRSSQFGLATANIIIAAVGFFAVMSGASLFAQYELTTRLLLLQFFVGANLVASLLVWSNIEEIRLLGLNLQDANYKAREDPLTRVLNRRGFEENASLLLQDYSCQNSSHYLLMFDIDDFKLINDEFGHDAGDLVLQTVTKKVLHCIREEDLLCRFGGEEFVLLFAHSETDSAQIMAERVLQSVRDIQLQYEYHVIPKVTVSLGLTQITEADSLHSLIRRTDKLLYQAKAEGKDCFVDDINRIEISREITLLS